MSESVSKYMKDPMGRIHREGKHVATVTADGGLEFVDPNDRQRLAASITRWLKSEAEKPEETQVEDSQPAVEALPPTSEAPAPPKKMTESDRQAAEAKSLAAEGAREAAIYAADVADDKEFARRNNCPPPPKKNPQFGDKTPAYVEWLHQHRPDKFKAKFGVKGKGKVPAFKINPETGVEEHVGYREATMANRKTHLTEKVEDQGGLADDQDWNA